ncbi:MAG: hypothetical protein IJE08_02920 [Clostridia bacterium]|nr:hypothetical protein [Clostridia bacterium]
MRIFRRRGSGVSAGRVVTIQHAMVYMLNEYRVDQKNESNVDLRHITVLEEAHNLLKNTSGGESQLIGKSIEMLTNTILSLLMKKRNFT